MKSVPQCAVDFIKKWEGYSEKAYKCPAGQITIGYGISYRQGTIPVKEGETTTREKAEEDLREYLKCVCYQQVEDIEKALGRELTDNEKTAILSVSYNVCRPIFHNSKCKKYIMYGNVSRACKEWDWGVRDVRCPGLKKRRNEEIELFYGVKGYWK